MLSQICDALLTEAKNSPQLLADLAGLERYVAESYASRSLIELLQNADDAGATKCVVMSFADYALFANDGRVFSQNDFESLCRSASSQKKRGSSIGYRGIGFKSIVGVASVVYVISGSLETKFSREETATAIGVASAVPLIRIPHAIPALERAEFRKVLEPLKREGFTTFFLLRPVKQQAIDAERAAFDKSILLFLRSIQEIKFLPRDEVIRIRRAFADSSSFVEIERNNQVEAWHITSTNNGSDIAIAMDDDRATSCKDEDAVFHAFLPTLDPVGLRIKVNGDFSTDPSRTRLVLDDRTMAVLADSATLLSKLISKSLREDGKLLEAIVGIQDPPEIVNSSGAKFSESLV